MTAHEVAELVSALHTLGDRLFLTNLFLALIYFSAVGTAIWHYLRERAQEESNRSEELSDPAEYLLSRQDYGKLQTLAESMIEERPGEVVWHWYLALAHYHRGNHSEAEMEFEVVNKLNPHWRDNTQPFLDEMASYNGSRDTSHH